jgi:hypothetical protein
MLRRVAVLVPAVVLASLAGGCGALDVSNPTAIQDSGLNNTSGAMLLHGDALRRFGPAVGWGELFSGTLADEFLFDLPPSTAPLTRDLDLLDRRESAAFERLDLGYDAGAIFGWWAEARRAASVAMPKLRSYAPAPAYVGELFAIRGYATFSMAEQFCPGFPLNDVVDYKPVYGPPLSSDEAFARALDDLDSAAVYAADSARILNFVRVARGRALLGLGQFARAAAAVGAVPSDYAYTAEFGPQDIGGYWNMLGAWVVDPFSEIHSVADRDGGTGLDFVSAADPRVKVTLTGTLHDGVTPSYAIAKYPTIHSPIVLASGIEARLIEAEAALQGGGDWLGILNALRTTCTDPASCPAPAPAGSGGVAGLSPLVDPGTPEARVTLLFRERAFWLFATGHRLGDLRRLVARYGRAAGDVFPSGAYRAGGGSYSTATSIPFAAKQETPFNPAVTGCTSR